MAGKSSMVGTVVSTAMDKTAVVSVQRLFRHPQYQRVIRKTKKYTVHDERNECVEGDVVRIVQTRPLSKTKRWRVVEVMGKPEARQTSQEAIPSQAEPEAEVKGDDSTADNA